MIKYLMLALLAPALCACSAVGNYQVDQEAEQKADMHFVGVPLLAGAIGSSFPVSKDYSLTAGHVAKLMMVRVKAYNPTCDVALIYHDNQGRPLPKLAPANPGERIRMYGYNAYTAMPTSSAGAVAAFGWWDKPKQSCLVGLSSAGGIQGMSGGPVYGDNGEIVGVFTATHSVSNQTIFVPYQQISHWVQDEIKS